MGMVTSAKKYATLMESQLRGNVPSCAIFLRKIAHDGKYSTGVHLLS